MNIFGKLFQLPLGLETQTVDTIAVPAASRHIVFSCGTLSYGLIRAKRRSIGITVGSRGVEVRAPRWATLREIERFLREKEKWIWHHLGSHRHEREKFSWISGESIPLFGQPAALEIRPIALKPRDRRVHLDESRLVAQVLADDGIDELRALIHAWLRENLRQTGTDRVHHYARALGVPLPSVRISSARTRWGSCSAAGRISLNWRLVHVPSRLIDYVVAHEIAHLREMNHSSRFWSLLEGIYPGCREARRELNALERKLPDL